MADLADVQQVAQALGRDLTTDEEARIGWLLSRASATVRSYSRQQFDTTESTIVARVRDGRVELPGQPVQSIESVQWIGDDGTPSGTAAPFTFNGIRTLYVDGASYVLNRPEDCGWDTVQVTYTHGYTEVPEDVAGIVVDSAVRQLLAPGGGAIGLRSETVGAVSQTYSDAYTGGQVTLTEADKAVLDDYRRKARTVRTGPR